MSNVFTAPIPKSTTDSVDESDKDLKKTRNRPNPPTPTVIPQGTTQSDGGREMGMGNTSNFQSFFHGGNNMDPASFQHPPRETSNYVEVRDSSWQTHSHSHSQSHSLGHTAGPGFDTAAPDWRKTTKSIKSKLAYVLTHDAFQDVTFIVGQQNERVRAHKFMLLLTSSSFQHLVSFSDENKGISLPDCDPAAFRNVLKFIYTDKFEDTPDRAMQSLYIAKKFDIPALTDRCLELVRSSISESNVVSIYQTAKGLNEQELAGTAFAFILRNAKRVLNSDDFYELSYDNLCSLLESDELNVEELTLFQATLRWAEEKCRREDLDGTPEDLRYQLKRALALIRFPLLTSEEFTMYVAPREILSVTEMLELYKYFSVSPGNRGNLLPLSFGNKRRGTSSPKVPIYPLIRLQDIGTGPWGCNGKLWQIRFMVDRPISIRGYGFYGSYDVENPIYNVDIYLESRMYQTKVHASEVVQLHRKGGIFPVNFKEMVPVQANCWYDAGFTFRGPNTLWGARQLGEVTMSCGDRGTVTFRFEEVHSGTSFGVQNQASFQLPQILFTL